MAYGHLEIICGPMFAGKSTHILKSILWAQNGQKKKIMVLKPSFDTRYDTHKIRSHDGLSANATPIETWPDIPEDTEVVFIDEVQFFQEPHFNGNIVEEIKKLLSKNINVVATGLDADWQGNAFSVTAELLAMADTAEKITANCTICGQAASKTFKKFPDTQKIELGTHEAYEARCNKHWHTKGAQEDSF